MPNKRASDRRRVDLTPPPLREIILSEKEGVRAAAVAGALAGCSRVASLVVFEFHCCPEVLNTEIKLQSISYFTVLC